MAPKRKQSTSSPRSSRGLALVLIAVLALAVFGFRHRHANSDSPPPATVSESTPLMREEIPVAEPVRESPQEVFWQRALALIEAETDDDRREVLWVKLVGEIPASDICLTLDELQRLGLADDELGQRLLRRWAAVNGRAASAWAERLSPGALRESALSGVAIEWANANLASATAWAKQLPDSSEQQAALLAVANEAVRNEPVEALRLAVELPANAPRDELICRTVREWALQNGAAAKDWAGQIHDEPLRRQVIAAVALSKADSSPESAATLAVETLPLGRLLEDTVISIVQRWAQQQPEVAAAWVEQFSEGPLRDTAFSSLILNSQPTAVAQTLP